MRKEAAETQVRPARTRQRSVSRRLRHSLRWPMAALETGRRRQLLPFRHLRLETSLRQRRTTIEIPGHSAEEGAGVRMPPLRPLLLEKQVLLLPRR